MGVLDLDLDLQVPLVPGWGDSNLDFFLAGSLTRLLEIVFCISRIFIFLPGVGGGDLERLGVGERGVFERRGVGERERCGAGEREVDLLDFEDFLDLETLVTTFTVDLTFGISMS